MTLDQLYQIKVESYRDFRNHLLSCFNAYTVSVGLLGYFAFEAHEKGKLEQFQLLWCLLMGLLTFALFLSIFYVRHAHLTARHVETLSEKLKIQEGTKSDAAAAIVVSHYAEDGAGMRAAMWTFAVLNVGALFSAAWVLYKFAR